MTDRNNENAAMERLHITGSSVHITRSSGDAYRVIDGKLVVFIIPVDAGEAGRRTFLYEAGAGEVVPGFSYRDFNYKNWAFCFSSVEGCTVDRICGGSDDTLRTSFARKANIVNCDVEGFEESIVDFRRLKSLAEDNFIRRSAQDNDRMSRSSEDLAGVSSRLKKGGRSGTGEPLYDSVACVCEKAGWGIAPLQKIHELYGEDYTVYDIARLSDLACCEKELEKDWNEKSGSSRDGPGSGVPFIVEGQKAYFFSRALPARPLDKKDIAAFCMKSIRPAQMILLTAAMLMLAAGAFLLPFLSEKIMEKLILSGDAATAVRLGLVLTAAGIIFAVFAALKGTVRAKISENISFELQNALYHRLFHMPEVFFRGSDPGMEAIDATNAGRSAGDAVEIIITACASVLTAAGAATGICFCCPGGPVIAAAALPLIFAGLWFVWGKLSAGYRREDSELSGNISLLLDQHLSGIEEIRGAGAEERVIYDHMRSCVNAGKLRARYGKLKRAAAIAAAVTGILLLTACVMFFPFVSGTAGNTRFTAFCIYMVIIPESAFTLGAAVKKLFLCGDDLRRIQRLMTENPEYSAAEVSALGLTGAIELSGVSFRYSEDTPYILENVNFSIKAGEYVGIAGASGSGKTTLLRLILGFETPVSGRIYYDNKDLGSIDRNRLRSYMGVVLQEDKLLEGNIADNIRASMPGASSARVRQAVFGAGLDEDIQKLPMGLMTLVSRDGGGFSHSLYRRILIARAILSDPRILILDEAGATLDGRAGARLRESLGSMSCTRIVVAHDPEQLRDCRRIIALDGGNITCFDSFESFEASGLYRRICGE